MIIFKCLFLFKNTFHFLVAGVFCAVVSHPADTVVSKLNNDVGSSPVQAAKELGMKGTIFCHVVKFQGMNSDHHTSVASRFMERSGSTYPYDWYSYCCSMVHLRLC